MNKWTLLSQIGRTFNYCLENELIFLGEILYFIALKKLMLIIPRRIQKILGGSVWLNNVEVNTQRYFLFSNYLIRAKGRRSNVIIFTSCETDIL